MRRALLLLLCAGCNRALGLDPTTELDAYVAPGCAGARFVSTTDLTVTTMGEIHDPTLLDQDELWFTYHEAGGPYQIASATRADTTQAFDAPVIGSFVRSDNDTDPAITRDGLHILFITDDARVYQADRPTRTSPWSAAALVPGIDGEGVGVGFDITPDGLVIYMADAAGIRTARRSYPTGTFGPVTVLAAGLPTAFPTISPDELELFFNPMGGDTAGELHRITRTDRTLDFDLATEQVVYQSAVDADITADAQTLVYKHGGDLQAAHRECP